MSRTIITNVSIVNDGKILLGSITINNGIIENVSINNSDSENKSTFITFSNIIDGSGLYALPGVIDDQVHFRDPGLTYKGNINSESKAAIAGGVTSFMDMPNTIPNVLTQDILEEKYLIAEKESYANYSFFMGASNTNFDEINKTDPSKVCGVKVFMGSSTGNMLVDNSDTLEQIFSLKNILIATHCEDESIIKKNSDIYRAKYGEDVPIECHPKIRSREACYKSTYKAVELAKKHGTRLHVLHISTEDELELFSNSEALEHKKITAEVCVHHLLFNKSDYKKYGRLIKWNPAIKNKNDQKALLKALKNDTIDVLATDHAPHSYEEKQQSYFKSSSGGPMVQHSLVAMLELYHQKKISLEKIVEKMCHAPSICFKIKKRGFIRKGYHADLVLIDLNDPWTVNYDNILYKCKWSPLLGEKFRSRITHTFVNGNLIYERGEFTSDTKGKRLEFNIL